MQGSINFDGTLSGSIAGSGGGGSEVNITPVVTSGTKIADYSIDEITGSLYAPTPETLPGTIVTKALRKYNDTSQTKIMTVTTLDTSNNQEVSQDIYAPSPVQCWYTPGLEQDYQIGQFTYGGVSQNVYIPYFQRPLTAGANITIDADNVISASGGGGVNYSTTEQDTGELWIDGTSHVYQKSFQITLSGDTGLIDLSGLNISKAWIKDGFYDIGNTCLSLNEFIGGSAYCYAHINQGLNPPYIDCKNTISANSTITVTIKYIKNV